jgi:hypothetical protein
VLEIPSNEGIYLPRLGLGFRQQGSDGVRHRSFNEVFGSGMGMEESKDFMAKCAIVPASLGKEVSLPLYRLFQCGLKKS